MKRHGCLISMMWAIALPMAHAQERHELPTVFDGGHFYATPTLADGQTLRLVVDTGGAGGLGWYVLYQSAVTRLKLDTSPCQLDETITAVKSLAFRPGHGLPAINDTPCHTPASVIDHAGDGEDGMIGPGYLLGHVWTFDYPRQQLWLESPAWQPAPRMRRAELGFVRHDGKIVMGYPRITLTIAGEPVDLLLDTGATAHPTGKGLFSVSKVNARGIEAASYITRSMLDRWHRQHPDWRVIDAGDDLKQGHYVARLIEVPAVTIADWTVGPVWFTERPDSAFAEPGGMSQYTDQDVVGAAGGNLFRHFVITLDYPRAAAWFACVQGCKTVAPVPQAH